MKDFVSFELAKRIKEKGFPQNVCDYGYITKDNLGWYDVGDRELIMYIPDIEYISAPTIAQVLKWLREEHKLHVCIDLDVNKNWFYSIEGIINNINITDTSDYSFYEEAAISGIGYVLDTLIK